MRPCRYTLQGKTSKYAALLLYPTIAAVTFFEGIYCLYCALTMYLGQYPQFFLMVGAFVASLGIAVLLIDLSVNCYIFENRKFQLTVEGLVVTDKHCSIFDWALIEDVFVVAFAASASRQNYQTVVCCMLQSWNEDFLRKILRSYLYGIKNTKKFIIIDYSPALVDELTLLYPKKILDLRKKQLQYF